MKAKFVSVLSKKQPPHLQNKQVLKDEWDFFVIHRLHTFTCILCYHKPLMLVSLKGLLSPRVFMASSSRTCSFVVVSMEGATFQISGRFELVNQV